MAFSQLSNSAVTARAMDIAVDKGGRFMKEWSPSGQFAGESAYHTKTIESTSTNSITGLMSAIAGTENTWEFAGDSIYDGIALELKYGAFTQADAADTIDWNTPIRKITWLQNGVTLGEITFTDIKTSFKCGNDEMRAALRTMNNFVDTKTGSQVAFTQTIPLLGFKDMGFSEDPSKGHLCKPVPGLEKLQIKITWRDHFTIDPNTATVPAAPSLTSARMFASRRTYDRDEDFAKDMSALVSPSRMSLKPITFYSSIKCSSTHFTSSAEGKAETLTCSLANIEQSDIAYFILRMRTAATSEESEIAVAFSFYGTGSRIEKSGSEFRSVLSNTALKLDFLRNHQGRLPKSGYTTKAVTDGELFILSSMASIFELQDIRPDNYATGSSPQLTLQAISGLSNSTAYTLDVYAMRVNSYITNARY